VEVEVEEKEEVKREAKPMLKPDFFIPEVLN